MKTDEELIPLILEDRDVECPGCTYNLRGVRETACPECGESLVLMKQPIGLARNNDGELEQSESGGFFLAQIGLAIPIALLSLALVMSAAGGQVVAGGAVMLILAGLAVHVAGFLVLQRSKHRFLKFGVLPWLGVLAACWWWLLAPIAWGILQNLI